MDSRWTFMNVDVFSEDDLNELIKEKIPECEWIDYKIELGDKQELAKDVSALANSCGGVLIYGVDEEDGYPRSYPGIGRHRGQEPIEEWIEKLVGQSISPSLKTRVVDLKVAEDKIIMGLFVEWSSEGPHMVTCEGKHQWRYYVRRGRESRPAREDEVREMYFRNLFGLPCIRIEPGFIRNLYFEPCIRLYNVGDRHTIHVSGILYLGSQLDEGMSKEEAASKSNTRIPVEAPILSPGTALTVLVGSLKRGVVFKDIAKALWIGMFEDYRGRQRETRDFVDLASWHDTLLLGSSRLGVWLGELVDLNSEEVKMLERNDPSLAQRIRNLQREVAGER
jgi:hypothetical protein